MPSEFAQEKLWDHQLYSGHRVRAALRHCTLLLSDAFISCFYNSNNKQTTHPSELKTCSKPFVILFKRSTKKSVTHVRSIGWWIDELVGTPHFYFIATTTFWALNCQKVAHVWLACGGVSYDTKNSLSFMCVPCLSPFPSVTFSLHCLLVAVRCNQILIEVSSRAK